MSDWLLFCFLSIYLYLPVLARGLACRRQAVCQAMGGILVYFFLSILVYTCSDLHQRARAPPLLLVVIVSRSEKRKKKKLGGGG